MTPRALADLVLATLFEPPCPACLQVNERPLDGAVCRRCWQAILPFTPPLCVSCGVPLPSWRVASLRASTCPRCRRQPRQVQHIAAVGAYDGALREIVHALKYGGRRSIAGRLSALMCEAGQTALAGADAVVPVPLHPVREWRRGFNQAALLAARLGLPVLPVLARVVHTAPQVGLPAARRHRNVRHAFALSAGMPRWTTGVRGIAGASVPSWAAGWRAGASAPASTAPLAGLTLVLVDDVMTTGATLEACARVLRAAGAREVRAITAARVVTRRPPSPPP